VDETFSAQNFPQASEHELRQRRRTWQELLRRFQRHGEATAAAEGGNSRGKNHGKMAGNHGKSGKNQVEIELVEVLKLKIMRFTILGRCIKIRRY
jgi:hypothetical protein